MVSMKTCIDDIIAIRSAGEKDESIELFNKLKYKSIDFIIIDPENMSPECLIEVRDGSHKAPEQLDEDKFIETLCQKNGIDFIIYQGNFEKIKAYFDENWEKQDEK